MPAPTGDILMKGDQLLIHRQYEHERMLCHCHRVGATVRADRHARLTCPGDIHAVVAGAEYLHQLETCGLGIGLIRQEAHETHEILGIAHGRSNVCSTGTTGQRVQRKPCRFHLLPQLPNVLRQLSTLGKDNRFLCHDALRTVPDVRYMRYYTTLLVA